jgi:deoxycytidylate deaminase
MHFRQSAQEPSEIVIGIIGPLGCNRKLIIDTMSKLAPHYSYQTVTVGLSKVIAKHCKLPPHRGDQYVRVSNLMTAGNRLRGETKDNSLIAKMAAGEITRLRAKKKSKRIIYVIDSIKHPEEVEELRNIYGGGFYLFAVHSSQSTRDSYLKNECMIDDEAKRIKLIDRDKDEKIGWGQSTSKAFHLADFFVTENGDNTKVWNSMQRFFDLIFGDPFKTPTFQEYAMFMAYGASTRSADMSRQVGAVVSVETEIVSTGANECPRPFGGTYWPLFDEKTNLISDVPHGRDYMNKVDRNGKETHAIIERLKSNIPAKYIKTLQDNIDQSGLKDITEYGRVVHAEMDAILGCARRGVSCQNAILFCTTFPCHNCAKHIIASGIKRVVYIEPYPKSKAFQMHPDAIRTVDQDVADRLLFVPFVGVGPRLFVNLFSLSLSTGEKLERKKLRSFEKAAWSRKTSRPRMKMYDTSYVKNEKIVAVEASRLLSLMPKIVITGKEDRL